MEEWGFPFMTMCVLAVTRKNFNRPQGQNKIQVKCRRCALESAKAFTQDLELLTGNKNSESFILHAR